jgi:hypothetical protein
MSAPTGPACAASESRPAIPQASPCTGAERDLESTSLGMSPLTMTRRQAKLRGDRHREDAAPGGEAVTSAGWGRRRATGVCIP